MKIYIKLVRPLKKKINGLSSGASFVLQIGLIMVLICSVIYALSIDTMMQTNPTGAYLIYSPMSEYIFLSLSLVVSGTLLLDLIDKYYGKRQ